MQHLIAWWFTADMDKNETSVYFRRIYVMFLKCINYEHSDVSLVTDTIMKKLPQSKNHKSANMCKDDLSSHHLWKQTLSLSPPFSPAHFLTFSFHLSSIFLLYVLLIFLLIIKIRWQNFADEISKKPHRWLRVIKITCLASGDTN